MEMPERPVNYCRRIWKAAKLALFNEYVTNIKFDKLQKYYKL